MAIGRNRVEYTVDYVTALLEECADRERCVYATGKKDEEIAFLRHGMEYLDVEQRDILEKIFLEKVSLRGYSKVSGFSRHFLKKRIDESILLLVKFFNVKYGYGRKNFFGKKGC